MSYKCNKCGKSLSSREALYEHLKKWHAKLKTSIKKKLYRNYERGR